MKWQKVDEYKRVSKRVAKKLYERGEVVYLCPCNLRPGWPWSPETPLCKSGDFIVKNPEISFEGAVDTFAFYNCNHASGHYPAYYVKEGAS